MEENIQNNEQQNVQATNNADAKESTKTPENFEEKFDEILASRMEGIAKSVLKVHGIKEDEEITNFINSWKANKEAKAKAQNDEIEAIKKENAELKIAAFKNEVETKIKGLSGKLGFDEKYTNQITKLADLSDVKSEDGKLSEEKLEAAISKVLEDCEAFKVIKTNEAKNANGFTTVGASHNEDTETSLVEKVRAAMKGY